MCRVEALIGGIEGGVQSRETPVNHEVKRNSWYVAVVGPTGVGKTTLTLLLTEKLNAQAFLEQPAENPFLAPYYCSPPISCQRWGYHSQSHYLTEAAKQQAEIGKLLRNGSVIQDVNIDGHKMYADLLFQQGILSREEYELYQRQFGLHKQTLPQPDLLIILRISEEKILERIRQRAEKDPSRANELNMEENYWLAQVKYWEEWIKNPPSDQKFLVLDAGENNWTKDGGDGSKVVEQVKQRLRELGFTP